MDNYVKTDTNEVNENTVLVFDDVRPETSQSIPNMRVKQTTKLRNMIAFARKHFKEESNRDIVFSGIGPATTKAISAVEVLKREMKNENLHQLTRIRYLEMEEIWEPTVEGLDKLKVTRNVPCINVLMSKDPFDENIAGYQPSSQNLPDWITNPAAKIRNNRPPGGQRNNNNKQSASGSGSGKKRNLHQGEKGGALGGGGNIWKKPNRKNKGGGGGPGSAAGGGGKNTGGPLGTATGSSKPTDKE